MLSANAALGPYRLLRPLRDTQVGKAFLGVRFGPGGFEKRVVVRCAPRELLASVMQEATVAARLSHSGIAHVLDAGASEDLCYVVSEYVPGVTLQAWLAREPLVTWHRLARVVGDAAGALAYVHACRDELGKLLRIVHGRITPRRITLSGTGHMRITGLGTSWAWPDHLGLGSPEELRGEPVDGRADVFALGAILQRYTAHLATPPALDAAIEHSTHPLPERRWTATTLQDALLSALR